MLRSRSLARATTLLLATGTLMSIDSTASEYKPSYYREPVKMLTTAYCDTGITKSGVYTRYGICAGKEEWLGKTVILYKRDGEQIGDQIGIYEVLDTGYGGDADGDGIGSIQEGKVIDVYFPTYEECVDYMKLTGGKCYMQIFDAEG